MTTDITTSPNLAARERLTSEDLETASIHSAAPSYSSEAPSYHSTAPHPHDPVPPYSPPAPRPAVSTVPAPAPTARRPTLPERTTSTPRPQGLPPVPSGPLRHDSAGVPSLAAFRIPSWSNVSANPAARHYDRVAQRRVMAATSLGAVGSRPWYLKRVATHGSDLGAGPAGPRETRSGQQQQQQQQQDRPRPLEDPYLVGEEAAARARSERLARENPEEVLVLDDRRWDFFLAQARDWQGRDRSWSHFRRGMETGPRGKLAQRIGAR